MTRLINGILILAAIVGFGMLVRQRRVLAELRSEHDRLSDRFGVLDVKDPSKFCVLRLDMGDPKQFVFRVYRPTVNSMQYRVESGLGGSSSGSNFSSNLIDATESIFRFRFVLQSDQVHLHWLTGMGSGRSGLGGPQLNELLNRHWDELEFNVLEDGEHDVDEPLRFLSVRVPNKLLQEFTQEKPHFLGQLAKEPLVEVVMGTPEAFEKLDSPEEP